MKIKTIQERWQDDDKIYLGLRIKNKLIPTIIGGIVGDALGVPVEFKNRDINIKGMTGFGTYNQPAGTWSDDTSLTLCLINNIIENKDENDLMNKFAAYQSSGYLTPYGEMFDIGVATIQAIQRFNQGIPAKECGGKSEYDNGNSALMRIAPLVGTLWSEQDFKVRRKEIERITEITHAHPRSTLGCIIYVDFLINLFHNLSPIEALQTTLLDCNNDLSRYPAYKNELQAYSRIFDKSILTLSRSEIKSDGYVVHSLEAAIWCFFNTKSYQEAVLAAVNLGGDTDTIGFITGTIAGIYYKMDAIPEEWVNQLAKKEELFDLCEVFFKVCLKKECIKRYGEFPEYLS